MCKGEIRFTNGWFCDKLLSSKIKTEVKAMTRLILVRHGESYANRRHIYVGHTDVDLEENGFAQARLSADYIAENFSVSRVYASDLKRAYNTGKCIAERVGVEIVADRELREIFAGDWEGVLFEDLTRLFPDSYSVWRTDIGNCRIPGGESVSELARRISAELERIALAHDGETVVIATHATPIRAMQTLVTRKSLGDMKEVPWATNASVSVLAYDGGEWKFELLSYDEHLGSTKVPIKGKV